MVLFVVFIVYLSIGSPSTENILEYNLKAHTNLAMHIHPWIEIEIEGEKIDIPANIGISDRGMRVIHTHDGSGELHIESPYEHQFYLRDFFTIWGKSFNSKCILDYCVDEDHDIVMIVNGLQSSEFENLPLRDQDKIKIVFRHIEEQH